MSTQPLTIAPAPREVLPEPDPWRFGWRYVREKLPSGDWRTKKVPLTEADVLHPQEEDFIVQTPEHIQDCTDLDNIIQFRVAGRLGVVVLHDCRIEWGIAGLGAHGPDIAVFENVGSWDRTLGTFRVAQLGARPLVVIEVTSPGTRNVDLDDKVIEYFRARIPLYIIIDHRVFEDRRDLRLIVYKAASEGYMRVDLDEQGRVWIEPLRMSLGVVENQLACFDEHGKRLGSYVEVALRLEAETERAEAAAQRAAEAEAKAQTAAQRAAEAEAKIQAEAEARRQLEARLRELEARLQPPAQPQ
jgi:colicin import membrane protein